MPFNNALPVHLLGDYLSWMKARAGRTKEEPSRTNETPVVRYKNQKHYLRPGMVIQVKYDYKFQNPNEYTWFDATITHTLSSQFTVRSDDWADDDPERILFLFYRDVGDTWRPV